MFKTNAIKQKKQSFRLLFKIGVSHGADFEPVYS